MDEFDFIGTKRVAIRRWEDGIAIRLLDSGDELKLGAFEFRDLALMIAAIRHGLE